MKWFDRWFYRQAKKAWDNKNKYDEVYPTPAGLLATVERDDSGIEWSDGLNIRVKRVNGGFIINFRKYDRVKDRNQENIHIITDEMEFNRELGKLITLESMR
jgi:hypothetical protein